MHCSNGSRGSDVGPMTNGVLDRARDAFGRRDWGEAFASFAVADGQADLGADDLELFARSAYLTGREEECVGILERAFGQRAGEGDDLRAAETAFWAGFNLLQRGDMARGNGWMARAERLLGQDQECAARGLLMLPGALGALAAGEAESALAKFAEAGQVGERCGDRELAALGCLGMGQAQIALGRTDSGLRLLDEVMVGVTSGEVSPIVSGIVYCAVIIACQDASEVRRAAEWTKALSRWCADQPSLVPFRGQCLVHRAQILQLNGAWTDATHQLELARQRLADAPGHPVIGMALYERAELHRLRGEYAAAESAYREADACGHETQPGLALLRLAEGKVESARAGIRRAVEELASSPASARLRAAQAEIALAAGDVAEARMAGEELWRLAAARDTEVVRAMAGTAIGSVLLAEDDPAAAMEALRRALAEWQALDAPYHVARVRVILGQACAALGDTDAADMSFDAAAALFRDLRAAPDLQRLERLGVPLGARAQGALTEREVQVLRAVASGKTNRAMAEDLFISEKTVARHLNNIYTKLGVSSRAAATAYAYEHRLV
jgi:DNA-binding NarL/FixJ family response regulator